MGPSGLFVGMTSSDKDCSRYSDRCVCCRYLFEYTPAVMILWERGTWAGSRLWSSSRCHCNNLSRKTSVRLRRIVPTYIQLCSLLRLGKSIFMGFRKQYSDNTIVTGYSLTQFWSTLVSQSHLSLVPRLQSTKSLWKLSGLSVVRVGGVQKGV